MSLHVTIAASPLMHATTFDLAHDKLCLESQHAIPGRPALCPVRISLRSPDMIRAIDLDHEAQPALQSQR
jgi:hypothetical protein